MSESIPKYTAQLIPMSEIFLDNDFNCRGPIDAMKCVDLAADIKTNGLDYPIVIRPYDRKPGKKYQVVAGHRRMTAFKINQAEAIPAYIRTDLDNDYDASAANLRENIQRENLTFLQEAGRISYFLKGGYSVSQIATMLGRTAGWVEPRKKLMELPKEVQTEADKGTVTQGHIALLHKHKGDREKMMEMLREIKKRKEDGEKAIVIKEDITGDDLLKERRPKPAEINDMRQFVGSVLTNKLPGAYYLPHVLLSYVMGDVSRLDALKHIKKECEALNLPFAFPEDVQKFLDQTNGSPVR